MARKQVLVTGSTGFIGGRLYETLVRSGREVLQATRRSGCDVTDWSRVRALERVDVVFHLAGITGMERSLEAPLDGYFSNVIGTLHMLEYCRINKVHQMVLASSYVYGSPLYLPVDESHPVNPQSPYGKSKILAEELCKAYAALYGLAVVALRVFNAYGPGQQGNMLVPTVLFQLTRGGEVLLRDPTPRRDFVYVDDVVESFLLAGHDTGPGFYCYNVASGQSVSVAEVVREIEHAWGRPFPVRYTGEQRDNEIIDCTGSTHLIAERLGWKPRVSLQEGIRRTVDWWRHHNE